MNTKDMYELIFKTLILLASYFSKRKSVSFISTSKQCVPKIDLLLCEQSQFVQNSCKLDINTYKLSSRVGCSQATFASQTPQANPSSHLAATRAEAWPLLDPW